MANAQAEAAPKPAFDRKPFDRMQVPQGFSDLLARRAEMAFNSQHNLQARTERAAGRLINALCFWRAKKEMEEAQAAEEAQRPPSDLAVNETWETLSEHLSFIFTGERAQPRQPDGKFAPFPEDGEALRQLLLSGSDLLRKLSAMPLAELEAFLRAAMGGPNARGLQSMLAGGGIIDASALWAEAGAPGANEAAVRAAEILSRGKAFVAVREDDAAAAEADGIAAAAAIALEEELQQEMPAAGAAGKERVIFVGAGEGA